MKTRRYFSTCLLLAALAPVCHDALAQFGGGMGGGGMGGMGRGGMSGGRTRSSSDTKSEPRTIEPADLAAQTDYRLDTLQDDLKLRPDQYTPWAAYSDRVKALAADMMRERSQPPVITANSTALQQLNGLTDKARDRMTALEDISLSAKALYNTLSPEQKKLADLRLVATVPNSGRPGVPMTQ